MKYPTYYAELNIDHNLYDQNHKDDDVDSYKLQAKIHLMFYKI